MIPCPFPPEKFQVVPGLLSQMIGKKLKQACVLVSGAPQFFDAFSLQVPLAFVDGSGLPGSELYCLVAIEVRSLQVMSPNWVRVAEVMEVFCAKSDDPKSWFVRMLFSFPLKSTSVVSFIRTPGLLVSVVVQSDDGHCGGSVSRPSMIALPPNLSWPIVVSAAGGSSCAVMTRASTPT